MCLLYCQQDGYFDAINLFNNYFKYDYILDPKKDTNSIIVPKNLERLHYYWTFMALNSCIQFFLYSNFSKFLLDSYFDFSIHLIELH